MLEINKTVYIKLEEHDRGQIDLVYSKIPDNENEFNYVEVEMKYQVPSFLLRLRPMEYDGKTYYHLINNEPDKILPYRLFMHILRNLQAVFPNQKLNWNIYSGQPIWEFEYPAEDLATAIKSMHPRVLVEVI